MKKKYMRHALLVIPAMLLAACGGGGGGGSANPPPAAGSTLVVSSANAKPVAADGLDATTNGGSAAGGASLVTGVQVDAVAGAPVKLSSVALVLATKAGQGSALATGVVISPTTAACSGGGTMTLSGNVSGGSSLVAGDTLTITANACTEPVDGVSTTINGTMNLTVNAGSFNASAATFPQRITMTINSNNLSVASNGVTTASTGDMKIDLTQNSATSAHSVLSGTSISNAITRGGVTRSSVLKNYSIDQETAGTQTRTQVLDATVVANNPKIGGEVVYKLSTPTAIVTDLALVVSGSVKVTGANSGLLLTVTSVDNFNLQLDTNGDGGYESTTATTTAELRGLL